MLSPEEVERLDREADARLKDAESWARSRWKSRTDTEAVAKRYREIAGEYYRTPAGKEAQRRATEIEAGRLHPHPDRSWSSPEEVAAVAKAWEEQREPIRALVARHRYRDASAALPAVVADPTGVLEAELTFQRALLDRLVDFPAALQAHLAEAPEARRTIQTARGEGRVEAVGEEAFTVRIGTEAKDVPWEDVEPPAVVRLSLAAFAAAPDEDRTALLAFCFAHGLRDAFYQAEMTFGPVAGSGGDADLVRAIEARFRAP